MLEHGILKYFCPILDKKDPPIDKELPNPSGPLSKVMPSEQVEQSFTKNGYTKLTPAIVGSHTSL